MVTYNRAVGLKIVGLWLYSDGGNDKICSSVGYKKKRVSQDNSKAFGLSNMRYEVTIYWHYRRIKLEEGLGSHFWTPFRYPNNDVQKTAHIKL